MEKIEVTPEIKSLAMAIRAYKHPFRQKLLSLIKQEKKISVSDIWAVLDCEQAVASQHLSILRRADLVYCDRDGKFKFYKINQSALQQLNFLAEYWANQGTKMGEIERPNAAKTITSDRMLKSFYQNADLAAV